MLEEQVKDYDYKLIRKNEEIKFLNKFIKENRYGINQSSGHYINNALNNHMDDPDYSYSRLNINNIYNNSYVDDHPDKYRDKHISFKEKLPFNSFHKCYIHSRSN